MKHSVRRRVCALLCAATLALPAAARAAGREDTVSLNFVNAEIEGVIKAVGKITGRNFLIDPRVKGTLNIVTNSPVPRQLSYDIMLSALRLQGYTAVESRDITKIVPEADAKLHAMPVGSRSGPLAAGTGLVTQVFPLRNETAAQLVPVVRPLISPNNTVTALASSNALIVTDYADNVARIARIIESIDQPQGDVQVVALTHASAVDLAQTASRLFAEGASAADASQRVTVMPDARTNSLLLRAENPARMAMARQLIAALDRQGAAGNIHVVYLKNAEAVKVAETLRAVLSGTPAPSQAPSGAGATGNGGLAASSNPPAANSAAPAAASNGGGMIQADPMSNALIITAPESTYTNLRHVIDQLDRRRAQVYVEALIAEITADRAAEWGIQWAAGGAAGSGANGVGVIAGSSFASGGNNLFQLIGNARAGNLVLPGNGINVAIGGGTVNVPGVGQIPSLAVLARFLESEAKANILSTPNLVTLDNEVAKIVIGRNVPFITGQYVNTGGGTTPNNPFQTIERRDVGLTLSVRPQISEGGAIRLEIYQEASALLNGTDTGAGPITTKRSIESMVLVDDGAIIALGGLMEDNYGSGEERIPVLGELPVVGGLFRYQTRNRSKTNLVVFLRPVILRDADSYAGISNARYDQVIGLQRSLDRPERLLRNEPPPPQLPPREADMSLRPHLSTVPPSDASTTAAPVILIEAGEASR